MSSMADSGLRGFLARAHKPLYGKPLTLMVLLQNKLLWNSSYWMIRKQRWCSDLSPICSAPSNTPTFWVESTTEWPKWPRALLKVLRNSQVVEPKVLSLWKRSKWEKSCTWPRNWPRNLTFSIILRKLKDFRNSTLSNCSISWWKAFKPSMNLAMRTETSRCKTYW